MKQWIKDLLKGKYDYELKCPNCKTKNKVFIKRGTTIAEYKKTARCIHCGCKYEDLLNKFLGGNK